MAQSGLRPPRSKVRPPCHARRRCFSLERFLMYRASHRELLNRLVTKGPLRNTIGLAMPSKGASLHRAKTRRPRSSLAMYRCKPPDLMHPAGYMEKFAATRQHETASAPL